MSPSNPSQPQARTLDPIAFAFERGFGPYLTPLRGKVPHLGAWQSLPPVDEDTVRDWVDAGFNLGLRCGVDSGVIVIDDDQAKNNVPEAERWVPPPTNLIVETPTGGRHYYYHAPDPCPGNSASKLAPYVDVRGQGGQVVYPGSAHPVVHRPYRWVDTGDQGTLPRSALDALLETGEPLVRVNMHAEAAPRGLGYANTALFREVQRVRTAPAGTRNDALNRASFALGQLVGGGELSESEVRSELFSAAKLVGDGEPGEDRHIESTLRSGLNAGKRSPRRAPATTTTAVRNHAGTDRPASILVPGSHTPPPEGDYVEQGSDAFCEQVLDQLPPGALYRRGGVVGHIHDTVFESLSPDQLRPIIDAGVRLVAGKETKDGEGFTEVYRPCSKDHAGLLLAYAGTGGRIRSLQHIAAHPVVIGANFQVAQPGWNSAHGVFVTSDLSPAPLDLPTARAVLEDLVVDFPFADPADRANFFGLMLTPVLRPAIKEPVPLHLLGAPIERSGKTKLAEIVLGYSVLGKATPAVQLGVREEEREKRILATLLGGESVVHLDNLSGKLDSPALASLLTANTVTGRELGFSRNLTVPNGLTMVGSANNLHMSGELAKRTVPITLNPGLEAPETRKDFRHPRLRDFVETSRERVLGALLGLVAAWRLEGMPDGAKILGGFERWSAVLGGIMEIAGYPEWLTNLDTFQDRASDFTEEARALVEAWLERRGTTWVPAGDLFVVAEELELFGSEMSHQTDRGRRTAFGVNVINALEGRTIGEHEIEVRGRGSKRAARLKRRS